MKKSLAAGRPCSARRPSGLIPRLMRIATNVRFHHTPVIGPKMPTDVLQRYAMTR